MRVCKLNLTWMLVVYISLFSITTAPVGAQEFFVDINNTTGIENGTSAYPYDTIGEAIALVTGTGTHQIRVAQGDYNENFRNKRPESWH